MKPEAVSVILLLCSLAFCCQLSRAGVTFLSPAHKPLDKGKPRVGRQVMELAPPLHDRSYATVGDDSSQRPLLLSDPVSHLSSPQQVAAPFEVGLTLHEEEFQVYRALHQLLQNIMGDPDATE
ncbi:ghrelin/obestatin prepropeptide isoform X1 [Gadus macrocephalus]|uniref:ghrelin/obestatin prepropeptide isoform X1 n=1 Tax=Gadus macrocephalus TaxID=80720 RepID=UPI0028CB9FCD|nr:ghrelin/obestatin prepropeptide isoform X1 [Gadus macrocephalus]